MPSTPDRVSPAGERQQNAAQNPPQTPSKPKSLQPDTTADFTGEDERRFYENYLENVKRRGSPR